MDLLIDPLDGCFLCRPEPWRVIFSTDLIRVIAGAGPICPGYTLVAPVRHAHTSAELTINEFRQFTAISEILKLSLSRHYNESYTAYEHAKTGSCTSLEMARDFSTYCHHCHRVFIPRSADCTDILHSFFQDSSALEPDDTLDRFGDLSYVYYETGYVLGKQQKSIYSRDRGLPSQFMRQVLTRKLETGRDWNWNADHRIDEMIQTVSDLRHEFSGLVLPVEQSKGHSFRLSHPASVDGLPFSGVDRVAWFLAECYDVPVIMTDALFNGENVYRLKGQGVSDETGGERGMIERSQSHFEYWFHQKNALSISTARERLTDYCREFGPALVMGPFANQIAGAGEHSFWLDVDRDARVSIALMDAARLADYVGDLRAMSSRVAEIDSLNPTSQWPEKPCAIISGARRPIHSICAELIERLRTQQ